MTTPDVLWSKSAMRELSADECRELLAEEEVGRLVFVDDEGPLALPVNFVLTDTGVVFRTAAHNSIARHVQGRMVALQADELDPFTRSAWSVLLRGRAEFLQSPEQLPDPVPDTWAEGTRWLFVAITTDTITGRRLLPS